MHADGQLIPAGELVTVPLPATLTLSVYWVCANVAVTLCAAFIVTTQLPTPLQAPPQPLKPQPFAGVAVSVTCVARGIARAACRRAIDSRGRTRHRAAAGDVHRQRHILHERRRHRFGCVHRHGATAAAAAGAAPAAEGPAAGGRRRQGHLRSAGEDVAACGRATDAGGIARHGAAAGDADGQTGVAAARSRPSW